MAQLGVYKEYISKNNINPKILAWVFFAEDISDILYENSSPTLNSYLNDASFTQNLAAKNELKDYLFQEFYKKYKKHPDEINYKKRKNWALEKLLNKLSNFITLINLRKYYSYLFDTESPENFKNKKIDLINKSILRFKEETEKTDSKLVFVYIPTWYEYDPLFVDQEKRNTRNDNYLLRRDIFDLLTKNDIEIIDTRKLICNKGAEEARKYYNFSLYGHFTPNGYRKVGNYISEEIKRIKQKD